MERIIRKKVYNTETAELVGTAYWGAFGDPAGYEERLYRTEEGLFFLYGVGGEASPYPAETIRAISKANAQNWLQEHAQ